MLFNSLEFALFLPLTFFCYWFIFQRNLRLQNLFIVVVSYIFYGWWDWRFLLLIAFTTLCSYISGTQIKRFRDKHSKYNISKIISVSNIILNLAILGLFKYFNFFIENFVEAFAKIGISLNISTLQLILPVGISFYTFQALSYSIDVYKRKMEPTNDIVSFFAYVSFFPQLVAGPIERAINLLPQFYTSRKFDYANAVNGCRQILWGLFKKVVVADNCARIAGYVFDTDINHSGSTIAIGALAFTFQIYCDFSGYSDIAIGTARLFGFNLMRNFNFPYFSRDIAEFWRRWHISLTTWFRDYIYIPLGGSRGTKAQNIRNTFIIFLVSGLWHGANWTYVMWGIYHAILFIPLLILGSNRKHSDSVVAENRKLPSIFEFGQIITTFALSIIGWIIFRSESVNKAIDLICGIFDRTLFSIPKIDSQMTLSAVYALVFTFVLIIVEWIGRRNQFAIEVLPKHRWIRWVIYAALLSSTLIFAGDQASFIYFQF